MMVMAVYFFINGFTAGTIPDYQMAAMAMANCLTVIPEGTVVRRGDRLPVLPLDWTRD